MIPNDLDVAAEETRKMIERQQKRIKALQAQRKKAVDDVVGRPKKRKRLRSPSPPACQMSQDITQLGPFSEEDIQENARIDQIIRGDEK